MTNSRESGSGQYSESGRRESPYLFFNPETLITPEMREWLRESRIIHIAPPWLPAPRDKRTYGGIEDVVDNNIAALARFGAKSQVIFGHAGNILLKDRIPGIQVVTPIHANFTRDPSLNEYFLLNELRRNPEEAAELEQAYVRAAYERIAEHGSLRSPDISSQEVEKLNTFQYRRGLGFVAISESQKAQMPNLPWIGVNYNGINLNDFEYNEKKENYMLFLGRVSPPKGVHNAVRVALETGIPLRIAGAVEQTPESLAYYDEKIRPYVDGINIIHYERGVGTEERKRLYRDAMCLLMLVEWDEPFGLVTVESMSSGTPVVASRRGAIPEIVEEGTGFVVNIVDNNVSEAVEAAYKVKRGECFPRKSREVVETRFSAEAMATGYTEIYMGACGKI